MSLNHGHRWSKLLEARETVFSFSVLFSWECRESVSLYISPKSADSTFLWPGFDFPKLNLFSFNQCDYFDIYKRRNSTWQRRFCSHTPSKISLYSDLAKNPEERRVYCSAMWTFPGCWMIPCIKNKARICIVWIIALRYSSLFMLQYRSKIQPFWKKKTLDEVKKLPIQWHLFPLVRKRELCNASRIQQNENKVPRWREIDERNGRLKNRAISYEFSRRELGNLPWPRRIYFH